MYYCDKEKLRFEGECTLGEPEVVSGDGTVSMFARFTSSRPTSYPLNFEVIGN